MDRKFTIISGGESEGNLANAISKSPEDLEREKYLQEINDFLAKEETKKEKVPTDLDDTDVPFFKKTLYFTEVMLKKCQEEPDKDYSRQLLTLSFHFYALGLYSKAKELISFVKKDYFPHKALNDISKSISARNKAEEYASNNKPNMAKKYQIEARFFLSMLYLIPFLREEESLKNSSEFQLFINKLSERPFVIQLAPYIGVL